MAERDFLPLEYGPSELLMTWARSGLSEEEACVLLRVAGQLGHETAIRRLQGRKGLRQWLIWFGGWERCQKTPAWELFRRDYRGRLQLLRPWPVSILGHRFTCFGRWAQMRWGRGYLVLANEHANEWPCRLYWSPNGTPWHEETRFYWGKRPER